MGGYGGCDKRPLAHCYIQSTVSDQRAYGGARHLTPIAGLFVVTALLLALLGQCLHLADHSHGALPATASAAAPGTQATAHGMCAPGPEAIGATVRDVEAPRANADVVSHAPSLHEAVSQRFRPVAIHDQPGQPHGWTLLLLLEIARK